MRAALLLASVIFAPQVALGGSGLVHVVNWYERLATTLLGSSELGEVWWPVIAAAAALVLVTALGVGAGLYRLRPETMTDEELLVPVQVGLRSLTELAFEVVSSTLESVIGPQWKRFVPLLGGTFFYILVVNLSGLVPGLSPVTEQINSTLAMALVIFLAFNYYGFREAGLGYVRHLAGPMLALAPLIFPIEVLGLLARPISLSLRLFANISGDHLVFSVFSTLMRDAQVPFLPVPAGLLVFGGLVACLQAFIFMTLSAVYIKLSLDSASDHH